MSMRRPVTEQESWDKEYARQAKELWYQKHPEERPVPGQTTIKWYDGIVAAYRRWLRGESHDSR